MKQISDDDIANLATLSGLSLQPDETVALRRDVEHILGYIEQLSDLDTSQVTATYQVTGLQNIHRSDEINQPLERDILLAAGKHVREHQITVPKVL